MNESLAIFVGKSLYRLFAANTGSTSWAQALVARRRAFRVSQHSVGHHLPSWALLSEYVAKHGHVVPHDNAPATYVHVDGGLSLSRDCSVENRMMDTCADLLEHFAFVVQQRALAQELNRTIRYSIHNRPA